MAHDGKDVRARSSVRKAVENAVDATMGRAGQAAFGISNATVREYLDELEPYLIEETVPRIVAGVTPMLIESIVPEVVDGVTEHITEVTVPKVIEGVTPALVDTLLPRIVSDLQPYLEREIVPGILDALMPKIQSETVPAILDALMPRIQTDLAPQLVTALLPMIQEQVAPQVVDALMPKIEQEVAPQLVTALLPMIQEQVAPQLVDALMPKIEQEVAPQLVDSLMPKIRAEVVPAILDDIVDDPRVRALIREQSQGLFLDALERFARGVARADDFAENIGRKLVGKGPRPAPESAAIQAPPGRRQPYAGAVSRGLAFIVDMILTTSVLAVALNTVLGLTSGLSTSDTKATGGVVSFLVFLITPAYFTLLWWIAGRTLGDALMGFRLCRVNGRRIGFVRAMVRCWLLLLLIPVWVIGTLPTAFRVRRRSWLDRVSGTEALYVGRVLWDTPERQQPGT